MNKATKRLLFLTAKDVARLFSCCLRTAQRKIQHYRIVHQKEKRHKIMLAEFCNYYDLPIEDAIKIIFNV
jgi:hypothetical protein